MNLAEGGRQYWLNQRAGATCQLAGNRVQQPPGSQIQQPASAARCCSAPARAVSDVKPLAARLANLEVVLSVMSICGGRNCGAAL
jgi:hypothetical protein